MRFNYFRFIAAPFLSCALLAAGCAGGVNNSSKPLSAMPNALVDEANRNLPATSPKDANGEQTAILAGGCFWGVEGVFEHVKGVSDVTSGFAGGVGEKVGYAESVKITYDPSKISYEQLLKVFFLVAHDPTELNRQGPDTGVEYRSAIFYSSEEEKHLAEDYAAELTKAKTFEAPIVTQILPLSSFHPAGAEHQDYMARYPDAAYIVTNDIPKLENLRRQFPDLYISK